MDEDGVYDRDFYEDNEECTKRSPEAIFGTLLSIIDVNSLCDVGGGIGLWTRGFIDIKGEKANLDDIVCIDGSYVNREQLLIPEQCFISADLEKPLPDFQRRFDLVMTLEVAEHLSGERARSFVEDLIRLSDTVLFSAAVPGQGGIHHVNEQHMIYWIELFGGYDYEPFDVIRPAIQDNNEIPYWYRQNTIVFAKKGTKNHELLSKVISRPLTNTVSSELYDIILHYKNTFEEEKNGLYKDIDQLNERNAQLNETNDQLNQKNIEMSWEIKNLSDELNSIKSSRFYNMYKWFCDKILAKIKRKKS